MEQATTPGRQEGRAIASRQVSRRMFSGLALIVLTLAFAEMIGSRAWGLMPGDIVVLEQGSFFDFVPAALIRIDPVTGTQTVISSGGLLSNHIGENPNGFTLDPYTGNFLVVDRAGRIVAIDADSGFQSLVAEGIPAPTAIVV